MRKLLFTLLMITFLMGCSDDSTKKGNKQEETEETVTSSKEGTSDSESESNVEESVDNENLKSNDKNNDNNEVNKFVEEYNNLASLSEGIGALDNDVEIDDTGAQVLYSSPEYGIIAIYKENVIDRYSVVISRSEPYEDMKGNALNATVHVATVLNLDYEKLIDEFKKAIDKEFHTYFEDNYTIAFFNHKLTGQSDFGLVVEFVKPIKEVE